MTRIFGIAVLGLVLVGAPACKTLSTPPTGDVSPDAQHARLAELAHLADLAEKTVNLVAALQQTEIEVYKSKLVANYTAEQHEATQGGFVKFAQETKADLTLAKDVAQADATRRTAISTIGKRARAFVDTLKIDNPLVKTGVELVLATVEMLNLAVV